MTKKKFVNKDKKTLPGRRVNSGHPDRRVTSLRRGSTSQMKKVNGTRAPNYDRQGSSRKHDEKDLYSCNMGAAQLNYEGVLLLHCAGNEQKAIGCFRQSLECIKSEVAASVDQNQEQSWSSSCQNEDFQTANQLGTRVIQSSPQFMAQSNDDHYPPPTRILPVQIHEPTSVDDFFYICTKAFIIRPQPGPDRQHQQVHGGVPLPFPDPQLLRAIVLYNLALTIHVKGIQTKCRGLQQHALSLYAMSYKLLHDSLHQLMLVPSNNNNYCNTTTNHRTAGDGKESHRGGSRGPSHTTTKSYHVEAASFMIGSLLMACTNNMGHLAYHLGDDFGLSRRTRSNLEYLLSWLLANRNEEQRRRKANDTSRAAAGAIRAFSFVVLDHTDIQGIQWNVRYMYPPTNAPAA